MARQSDTPDKRKSPSEIVVAGRLDRLTPHPQQGMPYWLLRYLVVILGFAGLLWLGWRLRSVVLWIVLSLVVTATFQPVIQRLEGWGLSRRWAVTTTFLAVSSALIGFLAYLAPLLITQAIAFANALPGLSERLAWFLERWQTWRTSYAVLPPLTAVRDWLLQIANTWLRQLIAMTGWAVSGAFVVAAVLVVSFFFLKDGQSLLSGLLRPLPVIWQKEVPIILDRAGKRVGDYMLGRLILMMMVGVLTASCLWILGVPYALLLGAIAFLFDIIPYVGPLLASLAGILVGFSQSWQTGLGVLGAYLLIQQTESWLLDPFVIGRSVGLHPVWVILAVIAGAQLMGVGGMILAVPIVTTAIVLIDEWQNLHRHDGLAPPTPTAPLDEERRAA